MPLIGFDAQATQGRRSGLGVYTSNLLNALKKEIAEPFQLRVYAEKLAPEKNVNTLQRLGWENWTLPGLVRRDKVDILHVPAFAPAFLKPCRLVVTVHDIAGRLFKNQIGRSSAFYWGTWLPFVVKQADRIIADSQHTQQDLLRHLKVREEKITVVYPSGHEGFTTGILKETLATVKRNLNICGNYFLFVGTLEPRKNLNRILNAFKIFSVLHPDYQLVLVGSQKFGHGKYTQALEREHALGSSSVLATGFVDHETLNALYCGARGLLFPSLYEGFGIPILEAMASGCPVLTSNTTSTPEVAGDAGILVDPFSVDEIAREMTRLAENASLCSGLKEKGLVQIKKFSWKKTARGVLAVYESLL